MLSLYHEVRRGLKEPSDVIETLDMMAIGKTETEGETWTASSCEKSNMHAEKQMLTSHCMLDGFPERHAPVVKAIVLKKKPCGDCLEYFDPNGDGVITPAAESAVSARFVPHPRHAYKLIFFLDQDRRDFFSDVFWNELRTLWPHDFPLSSSVVYRGKSLNVTGRWFSINGQERMLDSEVAEMAKAQRKKLGYWIGRL
jgi:hypothetical protein